MVCSPLGDISTPRTMPDRPTNAKELELPPIEEVERALDLQSPDREKIPGLYNLNVERVPIRRVLGMQVLIAFCFFHNYLVFDDVLLTRLIWVGVTLEVYAVVQYVALRRFFTRFERFHLGTFFLVADIPIFTLAVWGTGATMSWLWPLYLIRVADQMWIGRGRAAAMAWTALGFHVALLALLALGPSEVDWSVEILKLMILGALSAYLISIASLPWEVQEKTHAAKDLILRLEEQSIELDEARYRAELASLSKSTFLARMSNELRTPVNSVVGFANVLLKKTSSLGEEEAEYAGRIRQSGMHLLALINDVLDIARIEEGKLEVNVTDVDLEEVIRDTVRQLEGRKMDDGIRLSVAFPRTLQPLTADEARLRQVLINLLGNALKCTDSGFVRVEVDADSEGVASSIRVVDSGVGISPERLEVIFDAFEENADTTAREPGSTGLGLAISRSLCTLMNFELLAVSEVGAGSTFTIDLRPTPVRILHPDKEPLTPTGDDSEPTS
jgi:signal transduction histidine kinase